MSLSRLRIEPGRRFVARMTALGSMFALEGASDYTVNPWRGSVEALRSLGERPFDVFNHTGNFFIGLVAGMVASYAVSGAQKGLSELRGTAETASVNRMNRLTMAAGVVATAAAGFTFEKMMGSPDMLDVIYPLGVGALASGVVQVERAETNVPSSEQLPTLPESSENL